MEEGAEMGDVAAGPETPTTPEVRKDKEGLSHRVPGTTNPANILIVDFCLQSCETHVYLWRIHFDIWQN